MIPLDLLPPDQRLWCRCGGEARVVELDGYITLGHVDGGRRGHYVRLAPAARNAAISGAATGQPEGPVGSSPVRPLTAPASKAELPLAPPQRASGRRTRHLAPVVAAQPWSPEPSARRRQASPDGRP